MAVPRVGVGVLLFNGAGEVLVGQRLGSHGAGTWALPGGHLEFGESFEECAQREVLEETGLRLKDANYAWAVNSVLDAQSHYVTIFVRAALEQEGVPPQNMEPDKCARWQWVRLQDVPHPRFMPLQLLLDSGYEPSVDMAGQAVQLAEPVSTFASNKSS